MTPRERLVAAHRHEMPDRLPWAPKFKTWLRAHQRAGDLPEELRGLDYYAVARKLRIDIFDKAGPVVETVRPNVQVREEQQAGGRRVRWETPVGVLTLAYTEADDYAHTHYLTKYPFTSMRDYPVVKFIIEDTVYRPCYEKYLQVDAQIGDDGLTMGVGVPDTPLHRLMVGWMGYEAATYALLDYPQEMGMLVGLMQEKAEEAYHLAAASPAAIIHTGENTNADFETPELFRRYALPSLRRLSDVLHAKGKLHNVHM